jgi:hypothetical protein
LRKQGQPVVAENGSIELQSKIYGPLYNEIDCFISQTNRFSGFSAIGNYDRILTNHKYLLDKTDRVFQKSIQQFYRRIQEFNNRLLIAKKAIKPIIKTESDAYFKYTGGANSKVRVEITGETGNTVTLYLDELMLLKIKPECYFTAIASSGEEVIEIKYRYERSGFADIILSADESSELIKVCEAKVESDPSVVALRQNDKQLQVIAKKLRTRLKQMC